MIKNLAALRNPAHMFKVVTVDLVKAHITRDVVQLAADEVVDADDFVTFGKPNVGKMTPQKSGDASDKNLHAQPLRWSEWPIRGPRKVNKTDAMEFVCSSKGQFPASGFDLWLMTRRTLRAGGLARGVRRQRSFSKRQVGRA